MRDEQTSEFIARFGDGEKLVSSMEALDRCLTAAREEKVSEFWLIPSSPAKQLGSLALRVFGIKPRPAVVVHMGTSGALVTFRDRHGGDYRAVNREFDGESVRGNFAMHDRRTIQHRADEVFAIDPAFEFVRDFFMEGDRPWRISCRPVAI